jgi:NADPH-dependent 2,4-dienoyl-CoA reductase/sulfur reductase-like enzyme/nitrite reductase/ring-hydroxylating ferredoxin subunit
VFTVSAARTDDFDPGEMRTVEVSGKKILLLRTFDDQWHALSPECPHAGAPLEKGALCGSRLICPWHKSCFAASDGALLEPPSLESLQSFALKIVGEEIRIDVESATQVKRAPFHPNISSKASQTFAILGGGAAAAAAVRELRALGFAGRLVMVSQEKRTPYDRTLLSKMYLSGDAEAKQLPLRPESLLSDCRVEFLVAKIDGLDPQRRIISFREPMPPLAYDEVLVATGGKPKLLSLPGSDQQPLILRNVEDANRLIASAEQADNVVLIGASFISMEIASAFRERKLSVTIVSQDDIPFRRQLGPEMGRFLLEKHLENDVHFLSGTKVLKITGTGKGSTVELSNGQTLPADLVVSGVGIEPATAFLKNFPRLEDQSLPVDALMRVSGLEHTFAAGDLANFPLPNTNRRTRIEHWRVAQEQAKIAAANMMGLERSYKGVPYFWTYHYGVRYEFFGLVSDQNELLIDGDLREPKFITAYLREGRIEAIFAANRESETAKLFDQMQQTGLLTPDVFRRILHNR